ncbi:MAG: glycoside hydrolase family 2 TIM barrel-domain containing protein [Pseudomonadota bacterium]
MMLPLPLAHLLDPSLTSLGRLTMGATLERVYDLHGKPSEWRVNLDGVWRFQLVDRPDHAPADWIAQDPAPPPWRDIRVPGVWTRQATGDAPHYANWRMPFATQKPPEIPERNPTGLYRRKFQIAPNWLTRRTVLEIGGFESMVLVWCNGHFIGMAKDSRLASAFDLSDAIRVGENDLAIMVLRWCDATWIEDQDHWNHGGLHRSISLESRPLTHVRDLMIDTDYDPQTGDGTLDLRAEIAGDSEGHSISGHLEDIDGRRLLELPNTPIEQFDMSQSIGAQWAQSYRFDGYAAKLRATLAKAAPWSAEAPMRYRLVTSLLNPAGEVIETVISWIGFTRIEVSERRLRVNGAPIVLIGVNRHDHHPENGKTCSREDMRAELKTMKRHNINAIRTAHYPNDPALLDLADEFGLYVIDEANVECHARWAEVANHAGYQTAIIERTVRMIARDRNHPCIIGWSLGNEAGHGPAHDAAAAAARHLDPSRFVHYEGAVSLRLSFPFGRSSETTQVAPSRRERAATDVVCPMYPPTQHIVDWAHWAEATGEDDRPLILCEFSHAMGNSNGSISDYVDAFFDQPALAGGFVWDWRDQGLAEVDQDGQFFWAYGGHFGDSPNDANFNINGLVGPDGAPHPALREYMWAARPIVARRDEDGPIVFENRRVFSDASDLELHCSLHRDGVTVEARVDCLELPPGERRSFQPGLQTPIDDTAEWHLSLVWKLKDATPWAPAGHAIAWDQVLLQEAVRAPPKAIRRRPIFQPLVHERLELLFGADDTISGVRLGDQLAIESAVTPCLWRAPTDNDGGKPGARALFSNSTARWVGYGVNALTPGPAKALDLPREIGLALGVERQWYGAADQALTHRSIWHMVDGGIRVAETLIVPEAWQDLPRIGIRFEAASWLKRLEWFGLGPDESYPDRCGAQMVGVWRSTIAEQYHPYVRPQEYGARERCRWFRLLDEAGAGLQVTLPKPLSFTARPYHDDDLNAAETIAELSARSSTEVHIDVGIRGLGTGACGPDTLPHYRLEAGTHTFEWHLRAIERTSEMDL